MSTPTNNPGSRCTGKIPILECEAASQAVMGAMEWFRNPDPSTVQLVLSTEVFVSPYTAKATCEPCGRLCVAYMGIERPKNTEQLINCDLVPTEKIEYHFPAIPEL